MNSNDKPKKNPSGCITALSHGETTQQTSGVKHTLNKESEAKHDLLVDEGQFQGVLHTQPGREISACLDVLFLKTHLSSKDFGLKEN